MVVIDKERCTGCGQCARVCAGLVLSMADGTPAYSGRGCIGCGHCEAICPAGAIRVEGELLELAPETELEKLIMSRRSIRHYKADTPDKALIENALNKAQWAANSKNQQANGWSVVLGRDKVQALLDDILDWCRENKANRGVVRMVESGSDLVTCGAPCLIFGWIDEGAVNHELDCAIAMTTAELILREKGLGSCWGGFATRLVAAAPQLRKKAGIPENARLCCTLMVGWPDEEYNVIPSRPAANIVWK